MIWYFSMLCSDVDVFLNILLDIIVLSGAEEASFPIISRNSQPLSSNIPSLTFFNCLLSSCFERISHFILYSPNPSYFPFHHLSFWVISSSLILAHIILPVYKVFLLLSLFHYLICLGSFSYYCFHSHVSETEH